MAQKLAFFPSGSASPGLSLPQGEFLAWSQLQANCKLGVGGCVSVSILHGQNLGLIVRHLATVLEALNSSFRVRIAHFPSYSQPGGWHRAGRQHP